MGITEILILAVGLAMDAFAVSITLGLAMKHFSIRKAFIMGLYFGISQAVMPLIGYFFGAQFASSVTAFAPWIAFVLLSIIGGKMLYDGICGKNDETSSEPSLGFVAMFPLAVATSIDALAVGVSFAFLEVAIIPAVTIICIVAIVFSILGAKIGNIFGTKYKKQAEVAGGIILISMGLKILLEGTGILPF